MATIIDLTRDDEGILTVLVNGEKCLTISHDEFTRLRELRSGPSLRTHQRRLSRR